MKIFGRLKYNDSFSAVSFGSMYKIVARKLNLVSSWQGRISLIDCISSACNSDMAV